MITEDGGAESPLTIVVRFDSEIHDAVANGDAERLSEIVRTVLGRREVVSIDRRTGLTPLIVAVKFNRMELIKTLVEKGADVNQPSEMAPRNTPLMYAIQSTVAPLELAKCIMSHGASVLHPKRNTDGYSPFLLAVQTGNLDLCKLLVDMEAAKGVASPHALTGEDQRRHIISALRKEVVETTGETALHIAARCGNIDLIQWLYVHDWDDRVRSKSGKLPREVATSEQVFGILMDGHRNRAARKRATQGEGEKLLLASATNLEELKRLVEENAKLHHRDKDGNTILHKACQAGNVETTEYLLSLPMVSGLTFSPNTENHHKWTPLHLAATTGKVLLVDLLLEKGGEVRRPVQLDSYGCRMIRECAKETALKRAATEGLPINHKDVHVSEDMIVDATDIASLCGHVKLSEMMTVKAESDTTIHVDSIGRRQLRPEEPTFMRLRSLRRSPAAPDNAYSPVAQSLAMAMGAHAPVTSTQGTAANPAIDTSLLHPKAVDVYNFLHELSLSEYTTNLVNYGIDCMKHLLDINEDICKEVGILKPFHVKKLLAAVDEKRGSSYKSVVSAYRSQSDGSAIRPGRESSGDIPTHKPSLTARESSLSSLMTSSTYSDPSRESGMALPHKRFMTAPAEITMSELDSLAKEATPYNAWPTTNKGDSGSLLDGPAMSSMSHSFASGMITPPPTHLHSPSPAAMHKASPAAMHIPAYPTFPEARQRGFIPEAADPVDVLPDELRKYAIDARELPFSGHVLGTGGFGIVYKSTYRGSDVAVKVMKRVLRDSAAAAVSEALCAAISQEVSILERIIHHDRILQFRGVLVDPPAIVTEYMEKGNAEELLIRRGHVKYERHMLSLQHVVKIAADAAAGLMHLHMSSVLHRDIAARNLLVARDYSCKIADFGFSRLRPQDCDAHVTIAPEGPLRWLAPEALYLERISTTATDVFAFGVTMYELFTGRTPWDGWNDRSHQVVPLLVRNGYRMPFPPDLDPVLQGIISACWQHDPAARPSMQQVFLCLREWLQREIVPRACPTLDPSFSFVEYFHPVVTELITRLSTLDRAQSGAVTLPGSAAVGADGPLSPAVHLPAPTRVEAESFKGDGPTGDMLVTGDMLMPPITTHNNNSAAQQGTLPSTPSEHPVKMVERVYGIPAKF